MSGDFGTTPMQKPKRSDFATDDDFGEAYALWMAYQKRAQATYSAPKPQNRAALPPAAPVIPVNRKLAQIPARVEAERETWNLTTKARFQRAKENALAAQKKTPAGS